MERKSYSELVQYLNENSEIEEFFKAYSNQSKEEVAEKAYEIYIKALEVHNYRCLREFKFLAPRIVHNPYYTQLLRQGKEKQILDIGCALGTDLRKINVDGFEQKNLYGFDIAKDFIDLGYELFNDRGKNKITFIIGNILEKETVTQNNLEKKFDIVYSSSVIHLLEKKDIQKLCENIKEILADKGVFFGQTTGLQKPQERLEKTGRKYYLHSKDSLKQELEKQGFSNVQIIVKEHEKYDQKDKERFYEHRDMLFFYAEKN